VSERSEASEHFKRREYEPLLNQPTQFVFAPSSLARGRFAGVFQKLKEEGDYFEVQRLAYFCNQVLDWSWDGDGDGDGDVTLSKSTQQTIRALRGGNWAAPWNNQMLTKASIEELISEMKADDEEKRKRELL